MRMNKTNIKTILCNSVKYDCTCQHGYMCRYAHSVEELTPRKCRRGYSCMDEKCEYIHPCESPELFQVRIKALYNKKPEPVSVTPVTPEMKVLQRLIDEGKGMGKYESGIVTPVEVYTSHTRKFGDTTGLGVNIDNPGKIHTGFVRATTQNKIIRVNPENALAAIELALAMNDINITIALK